MLERIERGEATPMDLNIMASVCEHIIGNCLCVLGDAMAMPIGSMIEKFRPEFEAEIEAGRARSEQALAADSPSAPSVLAAPPGAG
jgi:NADH-quinone oxidoreductase subunit F